MGSSLPCASELTGLFINHSWDNPSHYSTTFLQRFRLRKLHDRHIPIPFVLTTRPPRSGSMADPSLRTHIPLQGREAHRHTGRRLLRATVHGDANWHHCRNSPRFRAGRCRRGLVCHLPPRVQKYAANARGTERHGPEQWASLERPVLRALDVLGIGGLGEGVLANGGKGPILRWWCETCKSGVCV